MFSEQTKNNERVKQDEVCAEEEVNELFSRIIPTMGPGKWCKKRDNYLIMTRFLAITQNVAAHSFTSLYVWLAGWVDPVYRG